MAMKMWRSGAVLGLSLEPGRMSCALLSSSGGRLVVKKALEAPLSLDTLADDPQLVGREIRNRLAGAGIRAHRCVLALPARWVLSLRTPLPPLAPADEAAYLQLQAERGFPYAPKDLCLGVSRFAAPDGQAEAMLVALPANHLAVIERVLKAARLRPLGITVGAALLLPHVESGGGEAVALALSETTLDLAVGAGGGLLALRALDVESAGLGENGPHADAILRELRITLGQTPPGLRERVRTLYLFGSSATLDGMRRALGEGVARLGLTLEPGSLPVSSGDRGTRALVAPAATAAAMHYLLGRAPMVQLLPPRPSKLKQWSGRVSTRATVLLAGAAAVLVLAAGGAFLWQNWRLSRQEAAWSAIATQAENLTALQETMRAVRPWFDDSVPSLVVMRALTEAFPADGGVWAKTVAIKSHALISCAGNARTNRQWLEMFGKLQATPGIQDLQVQEVRGEGPVQFRFTFRWNPGEQNGI